MGGQHSSCTHPECYHDSPSAEVVRVAPPELTSKQKQILEKAWEELERDIAAVGIITFVGMFETHPQVQDFFMPFKGLSKTDAKYSLTLRQHALRVMATVEKCIHRLHEPNRMRNVLEMLGERHFSYNAKIEYVDLLGSQFVMAVKENSPHWNNDKEAAWLSLVRIITFYTKKGWMEKQDLQAGREATRREYLSNKSRMTVADKEARVKEAKAKDVRAKEAKEVKDAKDKETKANEVKAVKDKETKANEVKAVKDKETKANEVKAVKDKEDKANEVKDVKETIDAKDDKDRDVKDKEAEEVKVKDSKDREVEGNEVQAADASDVNDAEVKGKDNDVKEVKTSDAKGFKEAQEVKGHSSPHQPVPQVLDRPRHRSGKPRVCAQSQAVSSSEDKAGKTKKVSIASIKARFFGRHKDNHSYLSAEEDGVKTGVDHTQGYDQF